ncbi:site-specific DNA-methyltransferase [Candidatus Babeliales bacterium]|nr:site-specific DNA-methyltransferase [Candidatus Babeliales bacterium]
MIYQLGDHILINADSILDKELVRKAIGDKKIRSIISDPPYGVAYVEGKKDFGDIKLVKKDKIIANDQLQTDDEYKDFTRDWLKVVTPHMESYNSFYIFNSDLMYCALRQGILAAKGYYSQMIVWDKLRIVIGRKDYLPQHELIAYGWFGRHKMERNKGKSILKYPKPNKNSLHPTMKPIGLMRRLILDATKKGEYVYDPFGGSGSTLIACEHTQRKCIMVELDKDYCDTIIKRWETLTGQVAKKIG